MKTAAERNIHLPDHVRTRCLVGSFNNLTSCLSFLFFAHRYAAQKESEYYEGSGYSKVVIDKKLSNLLIIKMSLHSRSENGLLVYAATEVNLFDVVQEAVQADCM